MSDPAASPARAPAPSRLAAWATRGLPWLITGICFAYLYRRIASAAGAEEPLLYMGRIFAQVDWRAWLLLMIPYSAFYLAVDTVVLWRAVSWFNAPIAWRDLLPIRASTYILSILNEQVGKGAIAVYLNRRHGVPGWQVGSSMLFIMFCEFYYLLAWALVGWLLGRGVLPEVFDAIPLVAGGALLFFIAFVAVFRSERLRHFGLRERQLLHAFRRARPRQYGILVLLRSPALLAAIWVYSRAAALFGVEIPLLDMLGVLPVIFFGTLVPGPFRAVAITLWTVLFPHHATQMAAFGLVQHNFFVLFNAAIGLCFMRRANRELFGAAAAGRSGSASRWEQGSGS